MLSVIFRVEEQLLNLGVEGSESLLLLCVREVYRQISSRGDNVELWVKHIDSMNNSVETRKSKSGERLILPHGILAETIQDMKKFS